MCTRSPALSRTLPFCILSILRNTSKFNAPSKMLQYAFKADFPENTKDDMQNIFSGYKDILRSILSSHPPAKVMPIKVKLISVAKPVQWCYCSQNHRALLVKMVSHLVNSGLKYTNPPFPSACAPLLVLIPCLANFRFTVVLRPVSSFTVWH